MAVRRFNGKLLFLGLSSCALSCESNVNVALLPQDPEPPPSNGGTVANDPPNDTPMPKEDSGTPLVPALSFRGPYDRVEIENTTLLDVPQDFAFEAWVFVRSYVGGHAVLNRWTSGIGDINLTFGVPEPLTFEEFPTDAKVPSHILGAWAFVSWDLEDAWISVVTDSLPSVNVWHHLAVSYGGGSFRLYVDGSLEASIDATDTVANAPNDFFIGASARADHEWDNTRGSYFWPPIDGYIAEVRISSIDRYPSEFSPEALLSPDGDTIGLWHLDESQGRDAIDSGPQGLDGIVIGAEWELAPPRPGAVP